VKNSALHFEVCYGDLPNKSLSPPIVSVGRYWGGGRGHSKSSRQETSGKDIEQGGIVIVSRCPIV
jgi:hypothetical protein